MSSPEHSTSLNLHRSQLAADAFVEYCNSERERRRNTGDEGFNPALFDEAVEMVVARLRQLEQEGLA